MGFPLLPTGAPEPRRGRHCSMCPGHSGPGRRPWRGYSLSEARPCPPLAPSGALRRAARDAPGQPKLLPITAGQWYLTSLPEDNLSAGPTAVHTWQGQAGVTGFHSF